MNEKEIRAKYEAQVCATQMEFDRIMSEMNTEQTNLNHPYLDRERELARQKELLEQQKQASHQHSVERYQVGTARP